MFIYENIPDTTISKVVKGISPSVYSKMPTKLIDFCKALEIENSFYFHHTKLYIGTKTIRDFHNQILTFLESHNAIKYSIEDTLQMACIQKPLAITYYDNHEELLNQTLRVKDISTLYHLASGNLWLPSHHVAAVTLHGHIPETVAVILRDYISYALKCEDKDYGELLRELITLANNKVIDEKFFDKLSKEKSQKAIFDNQNQPS